VGDKLKDTAKFFQDVRDKTTAGLSTIDSVNNKTAELVRNTLNAALSSLLPTGITLDTSIPNQIQFNMNLHRGLSSNGTPIDFDIGLPALSLDVNGNVDAKLSYDLPFNFGINTNGFYLDTSALNELKIGLNVTTPGLNTTGTLGFLQLNVKDDATTPTLFSGNFDVELSDPNQDGKLTYAELTASSLNLANIIEPELTADTNVNLDFLLSFGGSANFPSLKTDFSLNWEFNPTDPDLTGGEPTVAFNNVSIDLGSFFSDFVRPVIDAVQDVLEPIQPVIDVLATRMPIFSDIELLRNKFDGSDPGNDVSLLEVISKLSNNPALKFLDAIAQLDTFVSQIPSGIGEVFVPLGSFNLNDNTVSDLRSLTNLDSINLTNFLPADIVSELQNAAVAIGGDTGAKVASFLTNVSNQNFGGAGGDDGQGLAFPILQNPLSAFGLLLGRDVSLFTFDMPALRAGFYINEFFPLLGPLGVELKGDFNVRAKFAFGYDTRGFTEFATGGFSNPDLIFDGFFVSDTAQPDGSGGNDVPEVTLSASIQAFAALNAIVLGFGVGGGISANVEANLRDPDVDATHPNGDGKVRIDEIIQDFREGPLCLFDIKGALTAGLSAFV
jgi:hypothetical protein